MKEYKKPEISIYYIKVSDILIDSPILNNGGVGGWEDGTVEEFTF